MGNSFSEFFQKKNESRLNGQQGQYLVATTNQTSGETNGNPTTGRVIIAKAHPPSQNSQINQTSNTISGPVYVHLINFIFICLEYLIYAYLVNFNLTQVMEHFTLEQIHFFNHNHR